MGYLIVQILLFLILAAALGLAIGWWLKSALVHTETTDPTVDTLVINDLRDDLTSTQEERHQQRNEVLRLREELARARVGLGDTSVVIELREQLAASQRDCRSCHEEVERLRAQIAVQEANSQKPDSLPQPKAPPDDLTMISGVGSKLESALHELGIYYFAQIASFTAEDIARVNESLRFKGRIERERWIEQAKQLVDGSETDFSMRYKNRGE